MDSGRGNTKRVLPARLLFPVWRRGVSSNKKERRTSHGEENNYHFSAAVHSDCGCSSCAFCWRNWICAVSCGFCTAMESKYQLLRNLEKIVEKNYYTDEVSQEDLMDGVLKGYISGLNDPYSRYMTAEEYASLQETESGKTVGIGVTVTQTEEGYLQIMEVTEDSPAQAADLRVDDVLLAVDGTDLTEFEDYQDAVAHIKGEEGTTVNLTVRRGEQTLEKKLIRKEMDVTTSYGVMLNDQIGYIRISSFKENTAEQFSQALQSVLQQNAKGIVFDVREDGGGLVSVLEKILDPLLPAGEIATATYGNGKTETLVTSTEGELDLPMVVLVNGNTASAAELFAASLHDFGKAKLLGTQTFGKGIMQTTKELDDGGALTLTVATYQTTKGVCYHGVGITPDVVLEPAESDSIDLQHPDPATDAQLRQAMNLLMQ